MTTLTNLHQKTGQNLENRCLMSITDQPIPMFIYKCNFDQLVGYGIDECKTRSANLAANNILTDLKNNLEKDGDDLHAVLNKIQVDLKNYRDRKKKFDLISDVINKLENKRKGVARQSANTNHLSGSN